MDALQKRLAEQVRLHKHLYDSSMREHRDNEMIVNSWREIADAIGRDEMFCRRLWKNIRDRFVKAKKRHHLKHSVLGGVPPPILLELGWLSHFIKHREDGFEFEDDGAGPTKGNRSSLNLSNLDDPKSSANLRLPRPSLHLLVPPLRLMSACMWQVAKERNVDHYDKLAEFATMVMEMVPDLLNYKQRAQLILGLRARLILEDVKRIDKVDYKVVQDHLDRFQEWTTNGTTEEAQDGEVEFSKSAFLELVQKLLTDDYERKKYLKEVFAVQYGPRFDTALQILVWEFFTRLEEFLPVPSFSEVSTMFDISSLEHEFEKFVYDSEDLKRIFLYQKEHKKMNESEFTLMPDTIFSTLASRPSSMASEDQQKYIPLKSEEKALRREDSCGVEYICGDDEETDDSSNETNSNSRLNEYGLSPFAPPSCYDDADAAGDEEPGGEAAFQPARCSENSVEEIKEHLDLNRKKESDESINRSLSAGRGDVSENLKGADENMKMECEKTLASHSSLENLNVNSSVLPFMCNHCKKSFNAKDELKHHVLTHANTKFPPFACHLCDKKYIHRTTLKVHLRRHSGERPFACSYCDKRFLSKTVLKSHERIHTGDRPYACNFCDKTFIQAYTLTVHLRVHKKEKPYLCSTCGMAFPSSGSLLVHTRTHTGERPFPCDYCGKPYATSERLNVHRRTHTGERPYSCSQCAKSFRCSSGLKRHMRTHTGEKPYECSTCHKTFSEKSNMRIHLNVHRK